jgi:hypothetical protein
MPLFGKAIKVKLRWDRERALPLARPKRLPVAAGVKKVTKMPQLPYEREKALPISRRQT